VNLSNIFEFLKKHSRKDTITLYLPYTISKKVTGKRKLEDNTFQLGYYSDFFNLKLEKNPSFVGKL